MRNQGSHYLALILLSAALLPCLSCSQKGMEVSAAPAPSPSAAPAPAPVAIIPSTDSTFTVSGPFIVEHQLDVLAQRDGVIAEFKSASGVRVHAGNLWRKLDDRQLAADLEAARAKTRSIEADLKNWEAEAKVMQADYDRAQKMWDAHIISNEQLEHAKFKAESETWDVRRVRELLPMPSRPSVPLNWSWKRPRSAHPFLAWWPAATCAGTTGCQGRPAVLGHGRGPVGMRFTLPEKYIGRIRKGQVLPMRLLICPGKSTRSRLCK